MQENPSAVLPLSSAPATCTEVGRMDTPSVSEQSAVAMDGIQPQGGEAVQQGLRSYSEHTSPSLFQNPGSAGCGFYSRLQGGGGYLYTHSIFIWSTANCVCNFRGPPSHAVHTCLCGSWGRTCSVPQPGDLPSLLSLARHRCDHLSPRIPCSRMDLWEFYTAL